MDNRHFKNDIYHMCSKEFWQPSLLHHVRNMKECDKCSYKSPLKNYLKDPINKLHSGITFECNQCKRVFTEKGCLRTHTRFVHYMIQFLTWCDKCPFKGKTRGDLQRHILWIHEGKGPQCGLCD